MDVVDKDGSLLVVTRGGFGKQTSLKNYTPKGRATRGIATVDQKAFDEIGKIAAARVVRNDDELTIITANGVVLRLKVKDVKQSGRATKGVHLIKPGEGDYVASVARIASEDLSAPAPPQWGRRTSTGTTEFVIGVGRLLFFLEGAICNCQVL